MTEHRTVGGSDAGVRPDHGDSPPAGSCPVETPRHAGDPVAASDRNDGPCGDAGPCSLADVVRGDVRPGPAAVLTLLGLVVFAIVPLSRFIPDLLENVIRGLTGLVFLAAAIVLRRRPGRWSRWVPIADASFIATLAQFLAWRFSGALAAQLGAGPAGLPGLASAKLSQSLIIVTTVALLVLVSGAGLDSIFLRAGRLRYGALIGLFGFALFALILVRQTASQPGGLRALLTASPWLLAFVLANGLNEELLFRGLFLGRFEPFAGRLGANLATAVVFTAAHVRIGFPLSGRMLGFLGAVFLLSVLLGYLMRKSGSLLAPWLLHAGADLLIFAGGFYSATT